MKHLYNKNLLLLVLLCASIISGAQGPVSFYQDNFNGGITGGGWSPTDYGYGTGNFNLHIPPGSTIRAAYLFAGRLGLASDIQVQLNNRVLTFNSSTVVTPVFSSLLYGYQSAVCAVDVTDSLDPTVQQYALTVPYQTSETPRYQDFYLYVAYNNPNLPAVGAAVFLNSQNITDTIYYPSMVLEHPYIKPGDFGVAMFAGYLCDTANDGEFIYIDTTYVGFIGNPISAPTGCTEIKGSFYYYSDSLHGLDGDTTLLLMMDSDALSNAASILPSNTDTINMTFIHQTAVSEEPDNNMWGVMMAYSSGLATGNNNIAIKNDVQAFPNPFINSVFVRINAPGATTGNYKVAVYDVIGNVIYAGVLPHVSNAINLTGQPAGTYFIKVTSPSVNEVLKVIKAGN